MRCISLSTTDPCFNLSTEEILLKESEEEYLLLYFNSPSVITGKHQCVHREINTRYVFESAIPVIRRISGGGTVYHDAGNLNYSFISNSEHGKQVDFKKYTEPVIRFLSVHGVFANFGGKSDLKVAGLKFSGNAEHVHKNRVLHHGTLLYDASMSQLHNVLRKDMSMYSTRAVESNPSKVMNLKDSLKSINSPFNFRDEFLNFILERYQGAETGEISDEIAGKVKKLASEKFNKWEWNYGYGPPYRFLNSFKFSGHEIKCSFDVKDGYVTNLSSQGDVKITILLNKLTGVRHMPDDFGRILSIHFPENTSELVYNLF